MRTRVSFFVTCIVDQLFPRVGLAMADVLERVGYECEFREEQTCCGQPAFNSGFTLEATEVGRHFLKTFEGADYIVVPSGSCSAMIRHHFAERESAESANTKRSTLPSDDPRRDALLLPLRWPLCASRQGGARCRGRRGERGSPRSRRYRDGRPPDAGACERRLARTGRVRG